MVLKEVKSNGNERIERNKRTAQKHVSDHIMAELGSSDNHPDLLHQETGRVQETPQYDQIEGRTTLEPDHWEKQKKELKNSPFSNHSSSRRVIFLP
jgi:hypothetical protein